MSLLHVYSNVMRIVSYKTTVSINKRLVSYYVHQQSLITFGWPLVTGWRLINIFFATIDVNHCLLLTILLFNERFYKCYNKAVVLRHILIIAGWPDAYKNMYKVYYLIRFKNSLANLGLLLISIWINNNETKEYITNIHIGKNCLNTAPKLS